MPTLSLKNKVVLNHYINNVKVYFFLTFVYVIGIIILSTSNSREPQLLSEHPHLHKQVSSLSLVDIIMVGIAAMLGGAIFVLAASAIGLASSAVIIDFMINTINTLYSYGIC